MLMMLRCDSRAVSRGTCLPSTRYGLTGCHQNGTLTRDRVPVRWLLISPFGCPGLGVFRIVLTPSFPRKFWHQHHSLLARIPQVAPSPADTLDQSDFASDLNWDERLEHSRSEQALRIGVPNTRVCRSDSARECSHSTLTPRSSSLCYPTRTGTTPSSFLCRCPLGLRCHCFPNTTGSHCGSRTSIANRRTHAMIRVCPTRTGSEP